MQNHGVIPTNDKERQLRDEGAWPVAGVDEAGRGALAGPVVAGAVVSDWCRSVPWHDEVRDSKQLTAATRERLYALIMKESLSVGVGIIPSEEIDRVGIAAAARKAMYEALASLTVAPGCVLIDWFTLSALRTRQEGVPGGDAYCLSIACASIVAKVTRDRIMNELDLQYQGYGFAAHKGYGTEEHLRQLAARGVSPVHRLSYRPVRLIAAGLL
jgi:ribonuclease HII